jgi:putative DNA primase/helicase
MNEAQVIIQAMSGQWQGNYGTCSCPTHADRKPSLQISVRTDGTLFFYCHAGCDWRAIKDELRRQGILHDREAGPETTGQRRERKHRLRAADESAQRISKQRKQHALAIWNGAKPVSETLVPRYLRGRGIHVPLPPSIRGIEKLHHTPTGQYYPGMIGAVTIWPSREVVGVHRTYIAPDGSTKASIKQEKMMLGKCGGGAVRLAPAGEQLAITEGIETGLSIIQALNIPTWAALSTGGIRSLKLPPADVTKRIVICADNDPAGISVANFAAETWRQNGYIVKIAVPPQPGTDFNDLIKENIA